MAPCFNVFHTALVKKPRESEIDTLGKVCSTAGEVRENMDHKGIISWDQDKGCWMIQYPECGNKSLIRPILLRYVHRACYSEITAQIKTSSERDKEKNRD